MALTARQEEILQYLKKNKHAKIAKLSEILFVSDATIRRDLTELKKLGLLEKTHGGAVLLDTANEIAISVRYERDTREKQEVASLAVKRIPPFKTVFIDNSSTVLFLAKQMNLQYKTVVTNGLLLAQELSKQEDINILLPGGNLLYHTNSLTGTTTMRCLEELRFDLMICSCTAIKPDGIFESSIEQSELKRVVLRNSKHRILLVDQTKIGLDATYQSFVPSDFNVIFTNADNKALEPFKNANIKNIMNGKQY